MKNLIKWLKAALTRLEGEAEAEVETLVADLRKAQLALVQKGLAAEAAAKEYMEQHLAHSAAAGRANRIASKIKELLS